MTQNQGAMTRNQLASLPSSLLTMSLAILNHGPLMVHGAAPKPYIEEKVFRVSFENGNGYERFDYGFLTGIDAD